MKEREGVFDVVSGGGAPKDEEEGRGGERAWNVDGSLRPFLDERNVHTREEGFRAKAQEEVPADERGERDRGGESRRGA